MPIRLLCALDFPGKITGVGCHFPLMDLKEFVKRVDARLMAGVCPILGFTSQSSAEAARVTMVECMGFGASSASFQSPASPS